MKTFLKKTASVLALAVMSSAFVFDVPTSLTAKAAAGGCDHTNAVNDDSGLRTAIASDGSYYLTDDITLNAAELDILSGTNVTLCLNGHTIEAATGKRIFKVSGELTLCDCSASGSGKLTGGTAPLEPDNSGALVLSRGGAVYIASNGTFTLESGTISGNNAKEGAGVFVGKNAKFVMNGGTLSGNTASHKGGGVYVSSGSTDFGTFEMNGGAISGENKVIIPDGSDTISNDNGGGGVYVGGKFTMSGSSKISGNTAKSLREYIYGYGGGVCLSEHGTFTMDGGTITENNGTYGGGVHITNGTFALNSGIIKENNAESGGGGVSMSDGTFTMNGASNTIESNNAKRGGGIYMTGGTINIESGTIEKNTGTDGGGVYVSQTGTFNMTGGRIGQNHADRNGGGAYLDDTCLFNMVDGSIDTNTANRNGGGVFLNNGTLLLNGQVNIALNTHKTDGSPTNVYLEKHLDAGGNIGKDNTITIGENFAPVNIIGVQASKTPDCTHLVNATTFDTGVTVKDISGKFQPDVDVDVVYKDQMVKIVGEHDFSEGWKTDPVTGEERLECKINPTEHFLVKNPVISIPSIGSSTNNSGGNSSNSSSDPSDNSDGSDSSDNSGDDSSNGSGGVQQDGNTADNANPPTGIAISLVPLAAALTFVMVTVKRNKK